MSVEGPVSDLSSASHKERIVWSALLCSIDSQNMAFPAHRLRVSCDSHSKEGCKVVTNSAPDVIC